MKFISQMTVDEIASLSNEEFRAAKIAEDQSRRVRKPLPDGRIVFECLCRKTIASVAEIEGRRRFKVLLRGAKKAHYRSAGRREVLDFWQAKREQSDDDYIKSWDTGGKCPNIRCQKSHAFTMSEIAAEFGALSWEELADREGFDVPQCDRIRLFVRIESLFVWRTDGTNAPDAEVNPFAYYDETFLTRKANL